jgi:hypothetical protein
LLIWRSWYHQFCHVFMTKTVVFDTMHAKPCTTSPRLQEEQFYHFLIRSLMDLARYIYWMVSWTFFIHILWNNHITCTVHFIFFFTCS